MHEAGDGTAEAGGSWHGGAGSSSSTDPLPPRQDFALISGIDYDDDDDDDDDCA
jgi:hypothetical protein